MLLAPWLGCADGSKGAKETGLWGAEAFELPPLGFATDALAPGLDQATMEIHHGKHHARLEGLAACYLHLGRV